MKYRTLFVSILTASMLAITGCNSANQKAVTITDQSPEIEQVSYSLGYLIANGNKEDIPDLNLKAFEKGFADGYGGDESKRALTEEQMQKVIEAYQTKRQEELIKEMETKAKTNKEAGEKWLADNAKKEGVQSTASGLQYKVITEGSGKKPKATDTVTVHYEGKTIDGKVFDSSYERGEPVQFPLNQVIKGWTEGVQLMSEGGKYELYIPSELAYGEAGNPSIEPNSVLIFTVELLDEEAAKKASEEAQAKMNAQLEELQKMAGQSATPAQ
ncbi:MAG: FKBP-type peptidyl-prolyl cis-trans isomerase [Moraxella sp.]|nr:FKBP-type peptidyl-prolyl cis-trans isomerase [Moraxella sp.]